jgi:hypothetical protein
LIADRRSFGIGFSVVVCVFLEASFFTETADFYGAGFFAVVFVLVVVFFGTHNNFLLSIHLYFLGKCYFYVTVPDIW